ncbi:hypothetical protein A2U01_0087132, partial [Trifolium medium]|nr:hypothetical protein [Trifolium medium]
NFKRHLGIDEEKISRFKQGEKGSIAESKA